MNAAPITGGLFATNQLSPETERCYIYKLRSHAAHCVAVESTRGWKTSKEKASNKIDDIVALAMASLDAVRGASELPLVLMPV